MGDLLFVGRFPWLGDDDIGGWISALNQVCAMNVEQVIPGHGKPAGLKEIADFRDMLTALRDGVAGALGKGMSEDEAVERVRLSDYEHLPRYPEWMPSERTIPSRWRDFDPVGTVDAIPHLTEDERETIAGGAAAALLGLA